LSVILAWSERLLNALHMQVEQFSFLLISSVVVSKL